MTRFVVVECEGYAQPSSGGGSHGKPGLSVCVLDTPNCSRLVALFRTEDMGGSTSRDGRRASVRLRARQLADHLNSEAAA